MAIKGDFKVEKHLSDVSTVGESNLPQIRVSNTYRLTNCDLTEGAVPTGDEDADYETAQEIVDSFKSEITSKIKSIDNADAFMPGGDQLLGPEVEDIFVQGEDSLESLKNCTIDIEIVCYYDVPVTAMETLIDDAKMKAFGK